MSELVANCPRCGSHKITFDLTQDHCIGIDIWKNHFEAFCICRHCKRAVIFVLGQITPGAKSFIEKGLSDIHGSVNRYVEVEGFINLKDMASVSPPEHLPKVIEAAFKEGATCISVKCYNAAGTMFRLCVDLATREMLPEKDVQGLNASTRRNLGLRLPWLIDNEHLPESLRELSTCIKDDGNDGAHVGSLKASDAEDLLDFTVELLKRLFTEPERLRLANARRVERRETQKKT